MIGKLKGVIDEIGEDHCIVDVHGVGYVAWCSSRTLAALPSPGGAVVLYIETYVREDVIRLYGFATPVERIAPYAIGVSGSRLVMDVLGTYKPSAYQTGNDYIVEVAEKKQEQKKGKNAEPEYSGAHRWSARTAGSTDTTKHSEHLQESRRDRPQTSAPSREPLYPDPD